MAAPSILLYNLDAPHKLRILVVCAQLKIACHSVAPADYHQPLAALVGERARIGGSYAGEGFQDEMLVMVNFTSALLQSFLNGLRLNKVPGIALKAVMTPTNAQWDSIRLHAELVREHRAMHAKK